MKLTFSKMIAVVGVLAGGCLSASAAEHIRVNVPFSFVLAGLEFQPGQYDVEQNNNGVLTVTGEGHGAMVMTIPGEMGKTPSATSVRFVTDGHEYHLVGLRTEETSREVDSQAYREHKLSIATR